MRAARRWRMVTGAAVGLVVVAAACGPASTPEATATPRDGQPGVQSTPAGGGAGQTPAAGSQSSVSGIPLDPSAKSGGVLVFAATAEGPTLNPWEEASGNSFHINHPVSNMLVSKQRWGTVEDYQQAAYNNLMPDLATDWEQSADGLTWTLRLRDGVQWSDGQPFTCADAKWSLDVIRSGDGLLRSPRAVHFVAVDRIECANDLSMVVYLKQPKPSLLEMIGLGYHVIKPKHVYENDVASLREQPPEVGTGPFVITERIPGEKTVFARKDGYWDAPLPYLDGLELRILNNSAQVAGLRAGRLDVGGNIGAWSGGNANNLVRECADCQIYPRITRFGLLFSLIPNQERSPWNTPEVKNAMSLAIDRQKVIALGYDGWGTPATGGIYAPDSQWAMPYERVKQIPGYDFENVAANQEQARRILADAGYQPGELVLSLSYSVGGLNYEPYAIPMIEDLNAIGITTTPNALETARYYDAMSAGTFDVGGHAGYIGGFDPDFILYEFLYTGSDRNYGRYANPEFDRLVDEQSRTVDPERRKQLAWDAAEIALRDHARIFAGFGLDQGILGARVRGFLPGPAPLYYGSHQRYDTAWLAD